MVIRVNGQLFCSCTEIHSPSCNCYLCTLTITAALACEAPKIAGSNFAGSNASYSFGSVISVECDRCRVRMVEGVRNLEEGTLTCTRNGKWDGLIPTCQCESSSVDYCQFVTICLVSFPQLNNIAVPGWKQGVQ